MANKPGSKPSNKLHSFLRTNVAHVDEYFGIWAMYEDRFRSILAGINQVDLVAHVKAFDEDHQKPTESRFGGHFERTAGGVAIVQLDGPLMKMESSFRGTSTVAARRAIRAADADDGVKAILLHVDSPGGTVAGTMDLAKDVAATSKPIHAFIADCGCSAAYWIASQADKVFTNESAIVGSIGTFAILHDFSQAAEDDGIKVHVVRAGDLKGMGVPGTVITDEQLAEMQKVVNGLNQFFLEGVAAGRKLAMGVVKNLANGGVHVGAAAAELGLTDGVRSLDEVIAALAGPQKKGTRSMSETTDTPAVASHAQIKAACPGADAEFIVAQLEANATIEKASTAWMTQQNERIAAMEQGNSESSQALIEENAALTAKVKEAESGAGTVGTKPGTKKPGESDGGSAIERFDAAVVEQMKINGGNKPKAIRSVLIGDKELHSDYLEEQRRPHPSGR